MVTGGAHTQYSSVLFYLQGTLPWNMACQIKCLAHFGVWSGLGAVYREELPWLCRLNWQLQEAWLTTTPSSSCPPNQTETNSVFLGCQFLGAVFNFLLGIICSWTFTVSLLHLILLWIVSMTMTMGLLVFGHEHTEIFGTSINTEEYYSHQTRTAITRTRTRWNEKTRHRISIHFW